MSKRVLRAAEPIARLQTLPRPAPPERLVAVEPGPDAIITPIAEQLITEWCTGWAAAGKLIAAGVSPPGPLLLHGPPGTGKTTVTGMLARRFAGSRDVWAVDAMRVTEGWLGATSANIAKASDAAVKLGAILVLEEIDTLASARGYSSSAAVENTRATTSIMRVLELPGPIVLTSNRIDVLDPAVLRRCEYVVEMPEPDACARRAIVAAVLGVNPGEVTIALTSAVPLARRARRLALLEERDPAAVFCELVNSTRSHP